MLTELVSGTTRWHCSWVGLRSASCRCGDEDAVSWPQRPSLTSSSASFVATTEPALGRGYHRAPHRGAQALLAPSPLTRRVGRWASGSRLRADVVTNALGLPIRLSGSGQRPMPSSSTSKLLRPPPALGPRPRQPPKVRTTTPTDSPGHRWSRARESRIKVSGDRGNRQSALSR